MGLVGPGARRRDGGFRYALAFIILLTATWHGAEARRVVVRGRLGPIVTRNISGNAFLGVFPRASLLAARRGRSSAASNGAGSRNGGDSIRAQMQRALANAANRNFNTSLPPLGSLSPNAGTGNLFPPNSVLAGFGSVPTTNKVAAVANPATDNRVPTSGSPTLPGGCGVIVDSRDGHGGAALCREPRPGGSAGGTRQTAPVFQALGANGGLTPQACGNLNQAICSGRNPVADERRVFAEGRKVVNAYTEQNRSLGTVLANVVRNPKRFFGQYAEYLDFVAKESGAFDTVAGRTLDRVREAIDGTAFPQATKEAMKSKLEGVTMRMAPDMDVGSLRTFVAQCGADGMTASAYAVPERKEIVVCPGMALRAKALGGDLMSSLMHVLAHECGHNCGADKLPGGGQSPFRSQFVSYGACLQNKHPEFNAAGMLGESVADSIGYAAIAKEIAGRSPSEAFEFLKRAVSPLCGTQSDGVHPSGTFRINVLLGENPEILQALQCEIPKDLCKLEGGTL